MKKLGLALFAMLFFLACGVGSFAATSSVPNAPGGAGIAQWMAGPDGTQTLINIQNIADSCGANSAALAVHVAFFDSDSKHMFDIIWPMSAQDNLGIAVTGDGTQVFLTFEPGEADETQHMFVSAGQGTNNLQFGYMTVAINNLDSCVPANCYNVAPNANFTPGINAGLCDNGNPLDDPDLSVNNPVVLPDMLIVRYALIFPTGVLGMNAPMIQGFMDMAGLNENPNTDFINTLGANAACGVIVDWNGNNPAVADVTGDTDFGGVDIQAHELYLTDNWSGTNGAGNAQLIADGCVRNGRHRALGSDNGRYWARFNVTPGFTDTNLVVVVPANSATLNNSANFIADGRDFTVYAFDDDEHFVSTPGVSGPEVVIAPFYSTSNPAMSGMPTIYHTVYEHGEVLIAGLSAPAFGYVFTTVGGTGADVYPLSPEQIAIEAFNLRGTAAAAALDGAQLGTDSDVILVP